MEALAKAAFALAVAFVCAVGLAWWLANHGGMWRKTVGRDAFGRETLRARPAPALEWAHHLTALSYLISWGP